MSSPLEAFGVACGTVFLAEMPDKTMVASLVLTTRLRRPFAVWCGVAVAFAVHVVLAVTVGSLLRSLPTAPVRLAVAALFLVGGVVLLRDDGEESSSEDASAARPSFVTAALTAFSVVVVAEFGDLTQLFTVGIASQYSSPTAVAVGAWCALAAVAALAVTAGSWIVRRVPLRTVQRVAGVVFLGFGAAAAFSVLV